MKYVFCYPSLLFSAVGPLVGAEEVPCNDRVDYCVISLNNSNPDKTKVHRICKNYYVTNDTLDNDGPEIKKLEIIIAFSSKCNTGTVCPFCVEPCSINNLNQHIAAEQSKGPAINFNEGYLCYIIPDEDSESIHYCLDEDEDLQEIQGQGHLSNEAGAFAYWKVDTVDDDQESTKEINN